MEQDPQITHGYKALWKGCFCVSISWAGHTHSDLFSLSECIVSPSPQRPAWAPKGVSRQSLCEAGLGIGFSWVTHRPTPDWAVEPGAEWATPWSLRRAVPSPLVVRVSQPLTSLPGRAREQKRSPTRPRFVPGLERSCVPGRAGVSA